MPTLAVLQDDLMAAQTATSAKSIVFDLGGVYFTDGTRLAIDAIASRYGIAPTEVKHCLTGELGRRYRAGQLCAHAFWEQAKSHWHIEAHSDELANIWLATYKPIAGTVALVKRLRAAGHELLFLSDNTPERVAYLNDKYGFLAHFSGGIFSYEAQCLKPDPRLYDLVLQIASHSPDNCVYIDDKAELLGPARLLGMRAIAFQNPPQLERAFQTLGLFAG